jgi:hypothetical protein
MKSYFAKWNVLKQRLHAFAKEPKGVSSLQKQEDVPARQGRANSKNVPRQKYLYAERGDSDLALDPGV